MNLSDLGEQLLAGMLTYGYPILALTLLIGAIGIPVPASLVATLAGTLLADGQLDPVPTILIALLASVAGDLVGYGVGRLGGRALAQRHGRWLGLGASRLEQAERLFERWAGPTLLLSRSLLAILAPAVNLLAGASAQRLGAFVAYDAAGRLVWVLIFVGLGYIFAGNDQTAADLASTLSSLIGILGVTLLIGRAATRTARPRTPPPTEPCSPLSAHP